MVVAASKVKLLCVGPEIALVRASRKPEIEQLSKVELKRHAVRARKLFDKWQGLARGQSRSKRRATGSSGLAENTRIKQQIFRDALDAFEAQLAKPAAPALAAAKPLPPTSMQRASEHRATRAATRKGLTLAEDLLNARKPKKKPVHAKAPAHAKAAVDSSATASRRKIIETAAAGTAGDAQAKTAVPKGGPPKAAPAKTSPPKARPPKATTISISRQREATIAAKQSRLARSGKTTRMAGHVGARGKRAQARRDTKR